MPVWELRASLLVCYSDGCDELSWNFDYSHGGVVPGSPSPTIARDPRPELLLAKGRIGEAHNLVGPARTFLNADKVCKTPSIAYSGGSHGHPQIGLWRRRWTEDYPPRKRKEGTKLNLYLGKHTL